MNALLVIGYQLLTEQTVYVIGVTLELEIVVPHAFQAVELVLVQILIIV
jgi:hypothetical protein